ncbi:MAG: sigma-70 family RNA polymerase sigma factor [Nannocystaceae bacterium]
MAGGRRSPASDDVEGPHLARHRFELQGGDPDGAVQAWYFAIARNAAMDHRQRYRRQRREASPPGRLTTTAIRSPTSPIRPHGQESARSQREAEIIDRVQAAVQLPTGQREVVEYHKLAGMSMAEVAQRLDIREGAVRVRAHRAYKALARWLLPMIVFMLWYPR